MSRPYKKPIYLIYILCTALLFGGCFSGGETLYIGTGGTSGVYYEIACAVTDVLGGESGGYKLMPLATEGSAVNIGLMKDGVAQMAVVQGDIAHYANSGMAMFSSPDSGFSAVAALYSEAYHIVAMHGIKTIEQLEGKQIGIGAEGSSISYGARQILGIYNIWDDNTTLKNMSTQESVAAFEKGDLDAFICVGETPVQVLADLSPRVSFTLLEIDNARADSIIWANPFYAKYEISDGFYESVTDPVKSVAVKALLVVSNELSEDMVYNLTKELFDKSGSLQLDKPIFVDPQYSTQGFSVPLHIGAERYYKEIGVR